MLSFSIRFVITTLWFSLDMRPTPKTNFQNNATIYQMLLHLHHNQSNWLL